MNLADYVIVFVFLIGMFYVGSIFYKWVGNSDDFYLAGRKLNAKFFVNFFNKRVNNEDGIKRFVENEYRQDDREWAYIHFKNKRA